MYGRFVGLDIGSDTVKITLVKRGLTDTDLSQIIHIKTPGSLEETLLEIKNIFTEKYLPKNDVAVSLPGNPISVRVLSFPFSDPKKIDQTYEFELENVSPFDLSDKVHGYYLVKRPEGSETIVCMSQKEDIRHLVDLCQSGGIDPKVITFAPLAFGALDSFLFGERPLVLIDIGASRMGFSLFDRGGIKRVRSSSKAGQFISEAISKNLGVSHDVAESRKREGFTGGRNRVLEEAMIPIVDEIRRTIQFFEIELGEEIKTIILSGGTSLMPGISDYLEEKLKKGVERFFIPDLGENNSVIFAQSFALATYGSALGRGKLNLRKGEFKYAGKDSELRRVFMVPALLLSLFILFSIYRTGARYFELRSEVEKLEAQTHAAVSEAFPNVKVIPRPMEFMEGEVKKVRDKLKLVEEIRGGPTPLDVLRDISASIPPNVKLTVSEVNFVDNKTVKMRGTSDSYDEVAKVEKALSGTGAFKQVIRESTETGVNNTVKFQMALVLK
jgi:Tfp pilus assembly PilM family ATPase